MAGISLKISSWVAMLLLSNRQVQGEGVTFFQSWKVGPGHHHLSEPFKCNSPDTSITWGLHAAVCHVCLTFEHHHFLKRVEWERQCTKIFGETFEFFGMATRMSSTHSNFPDNDVCTGLNLHRFAAHKSYPLWRVLYAIKISCYCQILRRHVSLVPLQYDFEILGLCSFLPACFCVECWCTISFSDMYASRLRSALIN